MTWCQGGSIVCGKPDYYLLPICPVLLSSTCWVTWRPCIEAVFLHSLIYTHPMCSKYFSYPQDSSQGTWVSPGLPELRGGNLVRMKEGLHLAAYATVNPLPSVFILLTHCFHLGWQFFCCWLQSLTVYRELRWMKN